MTVEENTKHDIGYLYIIKDATKNSKWVKVGRTIDPEIRLRAYNSSFPIYTISYSYLSEQLYNINQCENMLIEEIASMEGIRRTKSEWFCFRNNTKSRNYLIKRIVKKINKITDTYFNIDEQFLKQHKGEEL